MKSIFKILFVSVMIAILSACGDQNFTELKALSSVNKNQPQNFERPECEVKAAEYQLDTKILSYEIVDTANIKFGFSLVSGFFKAIGLNLQTSKGSMSVAMDMKESNQLLRSAIGGANSNSIQFGANIDLVKLFFDVNYYYQTPLSKLTQNGLNDTFSKLTGDLKNIQTAWQTNVFTTINESTVIVPVGSLAGLNKGDQFNIYNVDYVWRSTPCSSDLLMKLKTTSMPIAVATVDQVEVNASSLKIKKLSKETIKQGAVLEILSTKNNLKRPIRFGDMVSGKIIIGDKNELNILNFVREQIKISVQNGGYYIHQ